MVPFPDVGSPSAWRARIRFYGADNQPVAMEDPDLQRSFHGVRDVFQHCLISALDSIESTQDVGGNDLAVGYSVIVTGDYAMWFDIHDRRRGLKRWLTTRDSWEVAVDSLLREASVELVALLRAVDMGLCGHGLMLRPVSGPGGLQSRIEVSVPGAPAARLSSDVWAWSRGEAGRQSVRDMFAVLLAPGVHHVDVILYPGTAHEQCITLDATPQFADFIRGQDPSGASQP